MRTMFYGSNAMTFRYAKRLRAEMTAAEKMLWDRLSDKKIKGYRFKRQHPIRNYIADFYCHKAKLIIEVDGLIHEHEQQIIRDNERTFVIEQLGCRVLRFTNSEVINHIGDVITRIKNSLPKFPAGEQPPL